jgi:hypothetical protein
MVGLAGCEARQPGVATAVGAFASLPAHRSTVLSVPWLLRGITSRPQCATQEAAKGQHKHSRFVHTFMMNEAWAARHIACALREVQSGPRACKRNRASQSSDTRGDLPQHVHRKVTRQGAMGWMLVGCMVVFGCCCLGGGGGGARARGLAAAPPQQQAASARKLLAVDERQAGGCAAASRAWWLFRRSPGRRARRSGVRRPRRPTRSRLLGACKSSLGGGGWGGREGEHSAQSIVG